MARFSVFTSSQNPATDKPSFCSKNHATRLIRTASAVLIASRVIQLLKRANEIPVLLDDTEVQRAGYDGAVNRPPVGYNGDDETRLLFGQMWEKRESAGFEILQLCPPHIKAAIPEGA